MALYGDNLGRMIRPGTTWGTADDVLSLVGQGLLEAYKSLDLWENWKASGTVDTINLAILRAISPSDKEQAKNLLDSHYTDVITIRTMVQDEIGTAGADAEMPDDFVVKVRGIVSRGSETIALIDRLFHTSVAEQVADQVVPSVGNLGDQIANGLSAFLGNFLAGIWWIWAIPLAVLILSPTVRQAARKAVLG